MKVRTEHVVALGIPGIIITIDRKKFYRLAFHVLHRALCVPRACRVLHVLLSNKRHILWCSFCFLLFLWKWQTKKSILSLFCAPQIRTMEYLRITDQNCQIDQKGHLMGAGKHAFATRTKSTSQSMDFFKTKIMHRIYKSDKNLDTKSFQCKILNLKLLPSPLPGLPTSTTHATHATH